MGRLEQKVAIITGAGTGIGRSIALTFAREGANVVICGRTLNNLQAVLNDIEPSGKRALAIQADVSVKKQVQNVVERTIEEFGQIDILVNNAGITRRSPILDLSEEDWDSVVDTNLKGVFMCIQAVAKHMIQRKYGKIINISSIGGIRCAYPIVENAFVYT